jgi:carboxylesterase type B
MGSFPWQSNLPWLAGRAPHGGTYIFRLFTHSSFNKYLIISRAAEIPLLFSTHDASKYKDLTKKDLAAVSYLQNAWVSFAKDPHGGLSSLGWPRYNPENKTLVEIFQENKVGVEIVDPGKYDGACKGLKGIDTSGYGPYCEGWTGEL